jgi:dienelactone hydrolase
MTQALGHKASLLQLKAKHGFSNPAQVHNPNEAFEYDAEAAAKSWRQAVALMKRVSESR